MLTLGSTLYQRGVRGRQRGIPNGYHPDCGLGLRPVVSDAFTDGTRGQHKSWHPIEGNSGGEMGQV